MLKSILRLGVVIALCGGAYSSAEASNGIVTGKMRTKLKLENCGSGTGVKYPCGLYGTWQPVRQIMIRVVRASDNFELGRSYTDNGGNYTVFWTDNTGSPTNVTVNIQMRTEHGDGRFKIVPYATSSGAWTWTVINRIAVHHGTLPMGQIDWDLDPHLNVWEAAVLEWDSLRTSALMWNSYGLATGCPSGVTCNGTAPLVIFDKGQNTAGGPPVCTGGWANGWNNQVCLGDTNIGHYANQGGAMHEMGHIAEYCSNASRTRYDNLANYGLNDPSNQHGYNTAEWASAQYSEAIADHFANMALYQQDASDPWVCTATHACTAANGDFSLEAASGDCGLQNKWQINATRYFWDIYDSHMDSAEGTTDNLQAVVGNFCDAIASFPIGTGNGQRDEPGWPTINDLDGHATTDFAGHYSPSTFAQMQMNCWPQGAD